MPYLKKSFLKSDEGSFVPALAVALVPLLAAIGMVSDYSQGVSERAAMQGALDAASLSSMTLSKDLDKDERQVKLQSAYAANGGKGTVTLATYNVASDGTVTMSTSATYAMPTAFMAMAGINTVAIKVAAAARKNPALVEANFKIQKVSGWWNKTMWLYGGKFDAEKDERQPLMKITYAYNNSGAGKGYGTTTIYKITENPSFPNDRSKDITTQVQQQVCTTKSKSWYNSNNKTVPSDAIIENNGQLITACTTNPANSTGAAIDVSRMNQLYLQMDVPSGDPKTLRTDDASTSNRMYIDGKQSPKNKTVDIFSAVPCGQSSTQAWEDGGTNPPSPDVNQADFFYSVTGKCNFSQRASEVSLTQ
jgi:Flp pilus assembly protein TadG